MGQAGLDCPLLPASSLGRQPHTAWSCSCACRENFLVLDIFFEALTSEAMEQRAAYGLSALLGETRSPAWPWCVCMGRACIPSDVLLYSPGDLGGQMGLFIGASFLTLLEILDYIYEARGRLGVGLAWPRPELKVEARLWGQRAETRDPDSLQGSRSTRKGVRRGASRTS